MAEERRVVFGDAERTYRLPDWANDGAVLVEWMREHRAWPRAMERLKIQREGGYAGIDGFLFLIYFFTSGLRLGLKEFSERARGHHAQLAAIGGRLRLPTQSSLSRVLSAVEPDRVREFSSWLLREAPGIVDVLHHPSVLTRDAQSQGWHVFDWDPTVTVLRHRALPVCDDMPDGRRRSEALAEPGYSGRKRGDVQFSRGTLQHAGSGLWLGVEMAPGNGKLREAFQAAIEQVAATCEHADIAIERAVLRADGVAGNVPFITSCVEAGLHYITRLQHYQLLQEPEVVRHLNDAEWFEVPSSGSGPTRQATEVGQVTLEAATTSVRQDGTPFAPIETRVVVSRFRSSGAGRGAGVVLDGWQYELYATDLPPAQWPEAELVTGYYGRTGQENRFHQEDRELGLDRIFSYHLPGQQLATVVGLFVWNFYVCRGFDFADPPTELPPQPATEALSVSDPPVISDATSQDGTSFDGPVEQTPTPEVGGQDAIGSRPDTSSSLACTRPELITALDAIDWKFVLDRHQGWQWDAGNGGLRCPNKAVLPFMRVEKAGQRIRARFEAEQGVCDRCKLRQACIQSDDPHYRKAVRVKLPAPQAEPLYLKWLASRAASRIGKNHRRNRQVPDAEKKQRPIWRTKPLSWSPPETPSKRSSLAISPPALLPYPLH
ncbi:MAG: hypothetical protein GY946_22595 [bacterium]|nr:hypothetical protein [bacterium]